MLSCPISNNLENLVENFKRALLESIKMVCRNGYKNFMRTHTNLFLMLKKKKIKPQLNSIKWIMLKITNFCTVKLN